MREFLSLPFRPERRPSWYRSLGYFAAVAGITGATGVLWVARPAFSLGSIYLVYLVVVVAVAVGWGLWQGVLASVLAFLCANYFFTPPIFTWTVAQAQDVLALIIFLALATLTSQLVARLRREAFDARRAQQSTATLLQLSQTINRQQTLRPLLDEVCVQLCVALGLEACTIRLKDGDGSESLTAYNEKLLTMDDASDPSSIVRRLSSDGVLLLQFQPGRRLTKEEERLLAAFSEQLQIAIERARLQRVAVETEVLRRTDTLRAALLSAVAHDLRTPLGSIKAAATSLLNPRTQWGIEDRSDFLKAIVNETDHINQLVGNLLDMSRIEAGKLRLQKKPHRIEDVIETVLNRLQPQSSEHPTNTHIAEALPPVPMDEVEIDEVLTNLVENAIKYTPPGTPIDLSAKQVDGAIEVEVADRGPGIPPEHLPYLFDRFYRVTVGASSSATTTNGTKGMGLGLAIARGIVEAHGGSIRAANRPGGGMSFSFTLPMKANESYQLSVISQTA